MAIGVSNFQGITAPAIGAVQQSESEWQIGISEDADEDGNTAFPVPDKYRRRECRISGVGDAELASLSAGAVTKGTVTVYRRKQEESTTGIPRFEIAAFALEDRVDPA